MKRSRAEDTTTSRQSPRRSAIFARLQFYLFLFSCVPIETSFAEPTHSPSLRQRRQKKSDIYQNEPSYGEQSWIFEAINLTGAWNMGYSGKYIRVQINDNNWEHNHTEWIGEERLIKNNINAEASYSCGDPNNMLGIQQTNTRNAAINHGVAVTSIVGADGKNQFCGVGIAPKSKLSFCHFEEGTTNPRVLMHNVYSRELTADISSRPPSYDISINPFAYEGCSSEKRAPIMGLHRPGKTGDQNSKPENRKLSSQFSEFLQSMEDCPFTKFYNDVHNKGDDPCRVCTKSDFDFVDGGGKRDNVFQTASSSGKKNDQTSPEIEEYGGVSAQCAASVRPYCLRNFRRDEDLCTKWIEVINHGNTCSFKNNVGKEIHNSLETGAKEGRDGKGVVYVFPSGDSYGNGDNVNYQAYPKSRFVMTVGAIKIKEYSGGDSGTFRKPIHSTYSTSGSSVFVVAPGGDYDSPHKHVGAGGVGGSCGEIGYGTAFAAPVVGGVVALMLQAYQNATWRDVRTMIAETSKPVETLDIRGNNDDPSFGINAAGFGYSDLYGFGLIDARAAVKKAKTWNRKGKHVKPEIGVTERSGKVNEDIFDDSFSTTTSTIMVYNDEFSDGSSTLESVSVYLKLRYFNRGHLKITLRSPSGTVSLLSPGGRHEYGQLQCGEWWEFLTLRSWGEDPNGIWKLSITDTKPGSGDVTCIDRPGFLVPKAKTKMGYPLTCQEFESEGFCSDGTVQKKGALQNKVFYNVLFEEKYGQCRMKAASACCACGGGIKPDDSEVLFGQLEEWKLVIGDGSPGTLAHQETHFYDDDIPVADDEVVDSNGNDNPAKGDAAKPKKKTKFPTASPTEKKPPRTPPPTHKSILIQEWPDEIPEPPEEMGGFRGMMTGIKNFFSKLFGGGGDDDEEVEVGEDGEGETSRVSSIVAWIITVGFSILLLMRGSSLCNFHVNFSREIRNSS